MKGAIFFSGKYGSTEQYFTHMTHVGLRGKLDHTKVSWWVRQILWVGSLFNPDKDASKDERHGFDYMDKDSIEPILDWTSQFQREEVSVS